MDKKEKLKNKMSRLNSFSAELWHIVDNKASGTEPNGKLLFELGKLAAQFRLAISDVEKALEEWEQ